MIHYCESVTTGARGDGVQNRPLRLTATLLCSNRLSPNILPYDTADVPINFQECLSTDCLGFDIPNILIPENVLPYYLHSFPNELISGEPLLGWVIYRNRRSSFPGMSWQIFLHVSGTYSSGELQS